MAKDCIDINRDYQFLINNARAIDARIGEDTWEFIIIRPRELNEAGRKGEMPLNFVSLQKELGER